MKKALLSFAIYLLLLSPAFAQETPYKRTEEYCDVTATGKYFDKKVYLLVDSGQEREGALVKSKLKDASGKDLAFNSEMDALNYMNGQGWELSLIYMERIGNVQERHFIMKRRLTNQ